MADERKSPIQVAFTAQEREAIEAAAVVMGVSPATYLRVVGLRDARASKP